MRKNPLLVVFLTIFLDMLGFGILIPVIPQLFSNPHSHYFLLNDYGLTLRQGAYLVGLLTASYPIAQFFATPILGQLSDRYGRRPILLVSLAGTCISYLLFAYGLHIHSLWLLFISRIFDGLTGGNIAVAQAVIADVSTKENRSKNFGIVGSAFALGFIFGPMIGGLLSSNDFGRFADVTTPFYFAALLSFINVMSVKYQLPETHIHINTTFRLTLGAATRNIMKAFTMKSVAPLFITALLFQGGFTFYTSFAGVYLTQYFGFTESTIGFFFAYVGMWIIITQGFILRKLPTTIPDHRVIRVTMLMVSAALAIYPLAHTRWMLYALVPWYAVPFSLTTPKLMGLVSRSVGPERQGEILGISSSVQAIAQGIPPLISGALAANFDPTISIFTASFLIFVAGIYFILIYRPYGASANLTSPTTGAIL
jgi:DHA1 family tetracycline resistance protein-like MFS transporter